jgi:hypothetical protein
MFNIDLRKIFATDFLTDQIFNVPHLTGLPKPTIQWLKDDEDLQESADCDVIEEATYSCLVIPNPMQKHVGKYICRAANTEGICEAVFAVTMEMSK